MRDIRFRVWDEHMQEMAGDPQLTVSFRRGVIDYIKCEFSGHGHWRSAHHPLDRDRYKVMQFAGVHDQDGKEIFESDIVEFATEDNVFIRIDDKSAPNIMRAEIVFEDGMFLFDGQYGCEGREIPFDKVRVIGNLYEGIYMSVPAAA